jgi:Ca-activated chloride channel family protein
MKTSILLDHEPVADGGFFVRALLRIEGDPPADDDRVPLNLSLVLDRSGSMGGEPLRAALAAATTLVRRLRVEDIVSVVAYDDEVEVIAPPATGEAQAHLADRISSITVGGMTNLSGGWLRGHDLLAAHRRDGGVNRVLLLTDGRANVGITAREPLVGLARSAAGIGITTTTIGFGNRYDEDLLRAMADAGGGGAYYVEQADQASGVFEEELEGLLSLAAQNVRVAVHPGADADFVRVVHAYPSQAAGDVLTIEVGDLYAREPRRVLMEFLLRPGAWSGASADVARVTLTAHVLTEGGGVETHTIELPITLSPEEGGKAHPVVRREVLLLAATEAREAALDAQRRGDYRSGGAKLHEAVTRLEAAAPDDDELREELADLQAMEATFRQESVAEADVKYLKQRVYDTHRSRDSSKGRTSRTRRE